jgi:hypothetical protein
MAHEFMSGLKKGRDTARKKEREMAIDRLDQDLLVLQQLAEIRNFKPLRLEDRKSTTVSPIRQVHYASSGVCPDGEAGHASVPTSNPRAEEP